MFLYYPAADLKKRLTADSEERLAAKREKRLKISLQKKRPDFTFFRAVRAEKGEVGLIIQDKVFSMRENTTYCAV